MAGRSPIASLRELLKAAQETRGLRDRMKRPCPDCGAPLRRGKDRIKWFCENPECSVIYVVYDPLWLRPIRIVREARRRR